MPPAQSLDDVAVRTRVRIVTCPHRAIEGSDERNRHATIEGVICDERGGKFVGILCNGEHCGLPPKDFAHWHECTAILVVPIARPAVTNSMAGSGL